MKKRVVARILFGLACLSLLAAEFLLFLRQPYICSGLRVATVENGFSVTAVRENTPASQAGIKTGDVFKSISGVAHEDAAALTRNSAVCRLYSSMYAFDTPLTLVNTRNEVFTMVVPSDLMLYERLACLTPNDIALYATALIFVLLGLFCQQFLRFPIASESFIMFLFCGGLCISNAFLHMANTYAFNAFTEVLFEISSMGLASSVFFCIRYFFGLSSVGKLVLRVQKALCYVPLSLCVFRFAVLYPIGLSVLDSAFMVLTKAFLAVTFIYAGAVFIYLIRNTPRQSTVLLRFFMLSLVFSVLPMVLYQIQHLFSGSAVVSVSEQMYTVIPLLLIPVSITCAFIQARIVSFDRIASRIMVICCAFSIELLVVIVIQSPIIPTSRAFDYLLVILAPIFFALLEHPVVTFLYPQVENMEGILTELESSIYLSRDAESICKKTSEWMRKNLSASFLYFFKKAAIGEPYQLLYRYAPDLERDSKKVLEMMAERNLQIARSRNLIKHTNLGFSVPMMRGHEVFGYLYVGNKQVRGSNPNSPGEVYSEMEVHLTRTVVRIVMEAIMMCDIVENRAHSMELEEYNDRLAAEVETKTQEIRRMQDMMVLGMAAMVESRDNSTGGHIRRTSAAVQVFADRLLKIPAFPHDRAWLNRVVRAAPMHDLGKIAVDDSILRKAGPFTREEFQEMKKHAAEGARVVRQVLENVEDRQFLEIATNVAHYHHENWNGNGYPNGLAGEAIPLEARIMAFADVFDALVSKRCYKEKYSFKDAYEIIMNDLGSHFDPALGVVFLDCFPELERLYNGFVEGD